MTLCDHCHDAPPQARVYDVPELEGWAMFADEVTSRDLCGVCLAATSADGLWDRVEVLP